MLLDSDYYLIALPAVSLSLWAQWRLFSPEASASRIPAASGLSGAEAARRDAGRWCGTGGDRARHGQLSNHYDPSHKVLRLSHDVYSSRSLAALGIAAHEAGHALQHGPRYPGLLLRSLLVPVATLGSTTLWLLVLAGLFLGMFRLIIWSIFVLWFTVILQLINLPVEIDASRRAGGHCLPPGWWRRRKKS